MTAYLPLSHYMDQLNDIFFHKMIPSPANGSSPQSTLFLRNTFSLGFFKTESVLKNQQSKTDAQTRCYREPARGDPKTPATGTLYRR